MSEAFEEFKERCNQKAEITGEARIREPSRPWMQIITDEGDPDADAKVAELEAQGFNVIHRVIVSPKRQADETVH